MDPSPFALGRVVQQRRRALGLSQDALAARASDDGDAVRQSDISRLELGKVMLPHWPRLVRLAAALECSVAELLMAGMPSAKVQIGHLAALEGAAAALRLVGLAPAAPGDGSRRAAPASSPPPRRAIWRPAPRPPVTVAWPDHAAVFALIAAAERAIARSQALLAATAPLVAAAAD